MVTAVVLVLGAAVLVLVVLALVVVAVAVVLGADVLVLVVLAPVLVVLVLAPTSQEGTRSSSARVPEALAPGAASLVQVV